MTPVYDSGSQLDTPIQHWDREWWNNSCDCHHNLLHYNATANVKYVCNRRSSQLHQYVTPLIFSYLHRELSIYLERPFCPWFITPFCRHLAVRHLSDTLQPGWFTMTLSSVCQYWARQWQAGCDNSLRLLLFSPCWGWTDVLTVACCQPSERRKQITAIDIL